MTNIEKIRQEIDTRRQHMVEELMGHEENCEYHRIKGMHDAYVDLLTFLDYSLPEEKPSKDLEKVAAKYERENRQSILSSVDIVDAFVAGAEWQAKHSPLPEDSVAFNNGVEEGKRLMMGEAVEGEIGYWNQRGLSIRLDKSLERLGYDMDTKVKIIIIKGND